MATVKATEHFKQYLYGRHFTVISDHQPLRWLMTVKDPAARLARWLITLESYSFTITYKPGNRHGNADGLSRWPLEDTMEDNDNEEYVICLLFKHFNPPQLALQLNAIFLWNNERLEDQQTDADIQWTLRLFEDDDDSPPQPSNAVQNELIRNYNQLRVVDNTLYFKDEDSLGRTRFRYVVPTQMRIKFVKMMHEDPFNGHLGYDKTLEKVRERFYWHRLARDVKNVVTHCNSCQRIKNTQRRTIPHLIPIKPSRPFQLVTMDFVTKLPKSTAGNTNILVICDHFTKWTIMHAMKDATAHSTAEKFIEYVCTYGIPESVLTDKGKNFQALLMEEIYLLLDVHQAL